MPYSSIQPKEFVVLQIDRCISLRKGVQWHKRALKTKIQLSLGFSMKQTDFRQYLQHAC